MTLVEFLEARIDEDEGFAREAAGSSSGEWESWNHRYHGEAVRDLACDGVRLTELPGFLDEHVARWDPVRVLAECAAKRAIIELHDHDDRECFEMHRGIYGPGWPEGSYAVEGNAWAHPSLEMQQGPCPTLRLLAAPYASHPDFDPSWAGEPE